MVYMAQDSDFEKYNGCWIYRGQEKEVEIPEYINGELVKSTANMFAQAGNYWASSVTKVVLKHNKVTNMQDMFARGEQAKKENLDLSTFNTSNVNNMNSMFQGFNAETIDVSGFNTSNVRNMAYMFDECKSSKTIDVSNFDTSNVTNFEYMFGGCISLVELDLSNFVIKGDAKMDAMLSIGKSNLDVYISRKKDIAKLIKHLNSFSMPKFHIVKKYLDLEGLNVYHEKVKEEIKNSGQGLAVEIVSKEQLGETQNNSIIFVRK